MSSLVARVRSHPLVAAWLVTSALAAWLCWTLPVLSQEAYYWCYARHLALSYFDHPPMAGFGIALGTALFGDGVLGLRAFTLACAIGTTWVGQLLLRRLGAGTAAVACWVVLSMGVPMLLANHALATPDAPLTFFFTAALWALWRARCEGGLGWWLAAGAAAGGAALSKYGAVFLLVGGAIALVFDPLLRSRLRRAGPWLALATAAVVASPVAIWNAQHGFASWRFQTGGRWSRASFGWHWLLEFVGLQAVAFSPALLVLVPAALVWLVRSARRGDARAVWLLAFALPLPVFMAVNSLWIQVKINWLAPAFPPLVMGILLWASETGLAARRPRLVRVVAAVVAATLAVSLAAPLLDCVPQTRGPSWTGWDRIAARARELAKGLDGADGIAGNVFFFGVDYKDSAQLARNLERLDPAGQWPPVLAENVLGRPAVQFDYWDPPSRHVGEDAILVVPQPERRAAKVALARQHFAQLELLERVRVDRCGRCVLEADMYACHGYRGAESR